MYYSALTSKNNNLIFAERFPENKRFLKINNYYIFVLFVSKNDLTVKNLLTCYDKSKKGVSLNVRRPWVQQVVGKPF